MPKKIEDYEWFCPEPFTNINVTTSGKFRPCCLMSSNKLEATHFKDKVYSIDKNTHKEFYNSACMKRMRDAIRNGNDKEFLDDICYPCKIQENAGNVSRRQQYIDKFNNEYSHKKEELERIVENDIEPTFFHSIEVDGLGGNYCNLSCSMCHEFSSSGVLNDVIKLNEPTVAPIKFVNGKPSPLIKVTPSNEFLKELPTILESVVELKLAGGEPLLNKETYLLMDSIKSPENTNLRVITNGTIEPSKFIKHAKKFKFVNVNISIEGLKEVNDYIRYPSKWSDILHTYLKFKKTGFMVSFVTTINALNVSRLHEISLKMSPNSFYFTSYVSNNFYSCNSIPPDLKEMFLENMNKYKTYAQVPILISCLEQSTYSELDMISMLNHIKRRDKLRGTNLLDTFPEWRYYYEQI